MLKETIFPLKDSNSLNVIIIILIIGLFIFSRPCHGQSDSLKQTYKQPADSTKLLRSKYGSHSTTETIVNLPLNILYFPFDIIFKGTTALVKWTDQEQIVRKMADFFSSEDGRRKAYPIYDNRMFGFYFKQKGLLGHQSRFIASASLGFNNRQRYEMRFQRLQLGKLGAGSIGGYYQYLQDEPFYGIGSDSKAENRTNYAHEQIDFLATLGIRPSEDLAFGITGEYVINSIFDGKDTRYPSTTDITNNDSLPGLQTGVKLASIGLALLYDYTNKPFRPTSGGLVLFRADGFYDVVGEQYGFSKVLLDAATVFHLFYNRRLIVRVAGEITEPLNGKEVPFYHLAQLGPQETIRGFQRGRFRDFDMVLTNVQYNYPVWDLLDVFLFVDAGKVAPNIFRDFSDVKTHVGYGGGITVWGRQGITADFTFAWSDEGFRFYFNLNPGLSIGIGNYGITR
jgi:hypothetical protein